MTQLRWAWSDLTRQSKTGWWPAEKPAGGEGWRAATVSTYTGGHWKADFGALGADQPLTGTYDSEEDAIAAVEAWLAEHPGHLARHDASRRGRAARTNRASD